MTSDQTDDRGDLERRGPAGDIHDIRALTDTGAIVLPRRRSSTIADGARATRTTR